jgi:acetate kinase
MKILVLNNGSSSLKYQLISMTEEKVLAKGGCERIGSKDSFLVHCREENKLKVVTRIKDHGEALQLVLDTLTDKETGVIKSVDEIAGIGHRVLHDGGDFTDSVICNDEVIAICEKNEELGPLHMPYSNSCLKICREKMPNMIQTLTFDTSFHSTMPKVSYTYAIPYEVADKYRIRKYGFHGTSHRYVSKIAAEYLENPNAKIITCHLGNGSSMAAVKDGKCFDTTMGFTPLEGLMMGTRSGDIDPAVIKVLMKKLGMNIDQTIDYLNKQSGMLGVSGLSNDNRDLEEAAMEGNERARLALDMFAYRVRRYIGAFAAVLGGVDAIVFTGGIGENSVSQRQNIMSGLEFLGAEINPNLNNARGAGKVHDISASGNKVKVLVIPTNEELVIARDTKRLIEESRASSSEKV